jgi:hypothetical protein
MLKFFRKIRQKLLREGNLKRYSLYAIGEIFLVVIGILIALQVNNWSQHQKDKELGEKYLKRILLELQKDTSILNQKILLSDQLNKDYLVYLEGMYKEQRDKDEFIKLMTSVELNVDELVLTDIAYSEMVNTGNLDFIFDDVLKNQIAEYYREYKFIALRVKELNESNLHLFQAALTNAPILKYMTKGYMGIMDENVFSEKEQMYNKEDWEFINNPTSISFRLYEDTVYYYYAKQILLKQLFLELKEEANKLIELIEDAQ